MSREIAIVAGRAAAEVGMVDAGTITRRTAATTDPETGVVTPGTPTAVYTGACRIKQASAAAAPNEVGQAQVYQVPFELQVPMTVTGVQVEDLFTCTASLLDPDLVGRTFWIKGISDGSHHTARHFPMELVTG